MSGSKFQEYGKQGNKEGKRENQMEWTKKSKVVQKDAKMRDDWIGMRRGKRQRKVEKTGSGIHTERQKRGESEWEGRGKERRITCDFLESSSENSS